MLSKKKKRCSLVLSKKKKKKRKEPEVRGGADGARKEQPRSPPLMALFPNKKIKSPRNQIQITQKST
jgi:hypothetical protein